MEIVGSPVSFLILMGMVLAWVLHVYNIYNVEDVPSISAL